MDGGSHLSQPSKLWAADTDLSFACIVYSSSWSLSGLFKSQLSSLSLCYMGLSLSQTFIIQAGVLQKDKAKGNNSAIAQDSFGHLPYSLSPIQWEVIFLSQQSLDEEKLILCSWSNLFQGLFVAPLLFQCEMYGIRGCHLTFQNFQGPFSWFYRLESRGLCKGLNLEP